MMLSSLLLASASATAHAQSGCTIKQAAADQQCPSPKCGAPEPGSGHDKTTPVLVQEIDQDMLHFGDCCLVPCNFKCQGEGPPGDLCANFVWPPAGTIFCQSERECEKGESCGGCTPGSCSCDPTTGGTGMCTMDCKSTCMRCSPLRALGWPTGLRRPRPHVGRARHVGRAPHVPCAVISPSAARGVGLSTRMPCCCSGAWRAHHHGLPVFWGAGN
eukprot:gene4160-biopygen3972